MEIREHVGLKNYTSFFIGGPARYLLFAQDEQELIEGLHFATENKLDVFVFGGGSNVLVSDSGYNGLAIRLENVGIDILSETDTDVVLKVASGEVWDDVVRFACEAGFWGIENLSHIPGFTGGIPVQNVGAYGQEASQVVTEVEAYDRTENKIVVLANQDCQFGYRSSIFNGIQKGRYVILHTSFKLSKVPLPNFSYGDLSKLFAEAPMQSVNLPDIRQAVIAIRNQKFPFPSSPEKGNSGSFFRGPVLDESSFTQLVSDIEKSFGIEPKDRLQAMSDKLKVPQGYKTPAAFLIDMCGLKGQSLGGAAINSPQPAIIVNQSGDATSSDVLGLYKVVAKEVKEKTGVQLGIEPDLIGFTSEELDSLEIT